MTDKNMQTEITYLTSNDIVVTDFDNVFSKVAADKRHLSRYCNARA